MDDAKIFIDAFNGVIDRIVELSTKYREEFAEYEDFSEDVREAYLQVAEELDQIVEDLASTP